MVKIENINFRYAGGKRDVISGLSMQIRRGSLFGLLGPNGSGKTTLISLLTGLLPLQSGQIKIDGESITHKLQEIQKSTSLVPQKYAFYPRLNVLENMRFFGSILSIPFHDIAPRVQEALTVVGLESFGTVKAEHLSGGMQRRLNLAIGLLNHPSLLLLDEPTVGIDPDSRNLILKTIKHLNENGTTVVYTSHNMEEVEALCDEIGVLDNGRLLASGTLNDLLNGKEQSVLFITLTTRPNAEQHKMLAAFRSIEIHDKELILRHCPEVDLQRMIMLLKTERLGIASMKYGYVSLEDFFIQMTGRQRKT